MFEGKSILITGGTGTIGRYIVKKLCKSNPKRIVVYSRDEDKQFKMKRDIASNIVDYVIGDIRDRKRIDDAMIGVDYVFHTAAMKQVPIAEENPYEAVMTNIIGTYNVLQSAQAMDIKRVVVFSSDKAIAPTNCMGMTKGICERLVRSSNSNGNSIITTIRLGNVVGSRGSVLTVWKDQVEKNKKITLTSEKMTRFIMTLDDVFLLAEHALRFGKNGEVIFSLMDSCRIIDLARIFCRENNLDFEKDTTIIGMRNGEKEFEELYSYEEADRLYKNGKYIHISGAALDSSLSKKIPQRSNNFALLNEIQLRQWIDSNCIFTRI